MHWIPAYVVHFKVKKIQTDHANTHDVTNEKQLKDIVTWNTLKLYFHHMLYTSNWWSSIIWHSWEPCKWYMIAILIDEHKSYVWNIQGHSNEIWFISDYTPQKCVFYQPRGRSAVLSYWNYNVSVPLYPLWNNLASTYIMYRVQIGTTKSSQLPLHMKAPCKVPSVFTQPLIMLEEQTDESATVSSSTTIWSANTWLCHVPGDCHYRKSILQYPWGLLY